MNVYVLDGPCRLDGQVRISGAKNATLKLMAAALMIPGGVGNPDQLRMDENVISFVQDFFSEGKPVAAICHAPWVLVEAGAVRDRTVTSWPSLRTDIRNAGGNWVDEEVHVDAGLVSSRRPDDLPAFCAKLVEEICEGRHDEQALQAAGAGAAD